MIFDGDEDMWAYAFMHGWKSNENVDFNFFDAHHFAPLTDRAPTETVKRRLRDRLSNTKQALVLIGENIKNLYRFVRWELETFQSLDIPIIAVNLNGKRKQDDGLCPPIIRDAYVAHVPFKLKIIQYALENFPASYRSRGDKRGPLYYSDSVYMRLGI